MSHVRGMVVNLKTANGGSNGTDDHIYIGVAGTGGGREFPLDVKGFNDFEAGSDVIYQLGTVWDGAAISSPSVKNPKNSGGNDWNSPSRYRIEMGEVNQVYIRKGGSRKGDGDDRYAFDEVEVTLYGSRGQSRTFSETRDMRLANEHGLQIWLPEG